MVVLVVLVGGGMGRPQTSVVYHYKPAAAVSTQHNRFNVHKREVKTTSYDKNLS